MHGMNNKRTRRILGMKFSALNGQRHEIFCFWFFSWIIFPQASNNSIRVFSNFSKIRGDICKSRCTTGINDIGSKFAAGVNYTGGKFATAITD
jgi:hypothetical protein